jgi:prevent-host-death family protein
MGYTTFPSEDIHPISLFGNGAIKLLKDAQRNHRPVFLTGNGRAAGVFMDVDEYERLLELLEFHQKILASEAEADRGETISHERLEEESKQWVKQAMRRKNTRSNGQKRRNGR